MSLLNLTLPTNAGDIGFGELQAFVGLPGERSSRSLPADLRKALAVIIEKADAPLKFAIDARSAQEFDDRRKKVFADYVGVRNVLAGMARVVISPIQLDSAADIAFDLIEGEAESETLPRFGATACEQTKFSVWALKRTLKLLERLENAPAPSDLEKSDEYRHRYSMWIWWCLFHLDCFRTAIRMDKPLRPEVVEEIVEGLRSAVNAYIAARKDIGLRGLVQSQPVAPEADWDNENQELMDASMADLDREAVAEVDEY